ncbi:hypothetical protein LIER_05329 [Lithospermum erythrorhizon]|uniref:Aminotransferase-like plant mobile domain-containing protein n=1 Tax=Lithospermum erythrorhizon TaxID=34254 RepID=A0AAV3P0C4_LITER
MASFMANGYRVSLAPPVLSCIYRSLSQISLSDNPSIALECFHAHYIFGWMGSYLHAQHIATNRPDGPQMVRYHGKGRGNVYAPSNANTILRSCPGTRKATHPDREQPFFYDHRESQSPPNRALFVCLRTRRVCHRIGSEFIVEPYNPHRFSRQFGYTPTIPGLSGNTREVVDLPMALKFWRKGILSRALQTITFPGNTSSHTPPPSYKAWFSELFPSEAPCSTSMKHGKRKGLPAGVRPFALVFQSFGPSKRKRSSIFIL